ncbi:MAG: hypothetical protein ACYSWP_15595 [Planctomycetota bacterium]
MALAAILSCLMAQTKIADIFYEVEKNALGAGYRSIGEILLRRLCQCQALRIGVCRHCAAISKY